MASHLERQDGDDIKSVSPIKSSLDQDEVKKNDLTVIDRLIESGQPQFGVFADVKQINYMDYHSYLISQKPVSNWRKQLKANQFAFIQIVQSPYRICLAIATIKLATTAFVYIYNDENNQIELVEGLQPLTRHTLFYGDHRQGEMAFHHPKIEMRLQFTPEAVSLTLDCQKFAVNAELQRDNMPLAVCSPSGRRGWVFTQKEPFTSVKGELFFKKASLHHRKSDLNTSEPPQDLKRIELDHKALSSLDWTLGYMRHETNWFWASINSQLADGRLFMLNLSMGVNETGVSENACWINGQIYYLPPVMFRRDGEVEHKSSDKKLNNTDKQDWHISNQKLGWSLVDINLTFTPISVYKKTDSFAFVASMFEQWIGRYSGHIKIGDGIVVLDKILGLAEDHYARW